MNAVAMSEPPVAPAAVNKDGRTVGMSEPPVAPAAVNKDGRTVGKEDGKIGGYCLPSPFPLSTDLIQQHRQAR